MWGRWKYRWRLGDLLGFVLLHGLYGSDCTSGSMMSGFVDGTCGPRWAARGHTMDSMGSRLGGVGAYDLAVNIWTAGLGTDG
jgi:hypothetical protein